LECWQWDEFVLKIEFYALNLSCIMRIDVKVFVQWGCVSDIPIAGMDCVKYLTLVIPMCIWTNNCEINSV